MKARLGLSAALLCLMPLAAIAASTDTPPPPATPVATPGATPAPATPSVEPATPATKPAEEATKPSDAAAAPVGENKDASLICKRVEKVSGSRMGTKRLCLTKEEWRDYEEE